MSKLICSFSSTQTYTVFDQLDIHLLLDGFSIALLLALLYVLPNSGESSASANRSVSIFPSQIPGHLPPPPRVSLVSWGLTGWVGSGGPAQLQLFSPP